MLFLTCVRTATPTVRAYQIIQVVDGDAVLMGSFLDNRGLSAAEMIWMANAVNVSIRSDVELLLAHCKPVREWKG